MPSQFEAGLKATCEEHLQKEADVALEASERRQILEQTLLSLQQDIQLLELEAEISEHAPTTPGSLNLPWKM
jgi:hypothetical protein